MKLHQALDKRKHNIQQDFSILKKIIANSYNYREGEFGIPNISSIQKISIELQATIFRMCKIGE